MSISRSTSLRVVAAAGLIGVGLLPLAASADGCSALTDPKGDSEYKPQGAATLDKDPNLDILSIDHEVDGEMFVSTIKVDDLINAPHNHFGDRFAAGYTVGGKVVNAFVTRYDPSVLGTVADQAFFQDLVQVDGASQAAIEVTKKYDEKAETVTISYKVADLEKVIKTSLSGATLTKLTGDARAVAVAASFTYDTAAGTADYVLGSCDSGAGAPPAAGGTPAPAASPAPSGSPAPAPSAAPSGAPAATTEAPRPDCFIYADGKGDENKAIGPVPFGKDSHLDILSATGRTSETAISTSISVADLVAKPSGQQFSGHRFESEFKAGEKVVVLRASTTGPGSALVGGAAAADVKVSAVFDEVGNRVVLSVDRPSLEKAAGAPLSDGTVLTGTVTRSFAVIATGGSTVADSATAPTPEEAVYRVGDNACYEPPSPPLTSVGATSAQHGDTAAVAARLVDGSGAAVAGREVTFRLGSATAKGTTDEEGLAKAVLSVREKAGRRQLTLTAGEQTATASFTVLVEKTALKATGSRGAVTATLTDDDRKPVTGQVVTFTAGSLKKTARTNAKGVATASGFKPGSTVNVSYAGASGQYAASRASTRA